MVEYNNFHYTFIGFLMQQRWVLKTLQHKMLFSKAFSEIPYGKDHSCTGCFACHIPGCSTKCFHAKKLIRHLQVCHNIKVGK